MCGIVGYIGTSKAVDVLVPALKRLEYRGYDSAGVATINVDGLGARNLTKLAKTWALTDGRDYVIANDIKSLAVTVLAHRLKLNPELEENDGVKNEIVMQEILDSITPPKDPGK